MRLNHFIEIGPFAIGLGQSMSAALSGIRDAYPYSLQAYDGQLVDFELSVRAPSIARRWVRRCAQFYWDDRAPFHPLPAEQAPLAFEWGLNFAIAKSAHQYILLHAAVLAKDGMAVVMPAPPGSGKSTLTAALMLSGWQLLSDEFALIDPDDGRLIPLPRPISLKNRSIDLIRDFAPGDSRFSKRFAGTKKGDISLLMADADSIALGSRSAQLRWVVFPRWQQAAATELRPFAKGQTLMVLADNSFNLGLHGEKGFNLICDLLQRADCFELTYSQLDQGIAQFEELSQRCLNPAC